MTLRRHQAVALVVSFIILAVSTAQASDGPFEAEIDARIVKHRQGEAVITVVDSSGNPVPGAHVKVEQTRHAFLFGCNIFWWGPSQDRYRAVGGDRSDEQAAYRKQFADVFNYATLPFYWMYYEPEPDKPRHVYMDRLVTWCQQQDIQVKGHPLAWNWYDPKWLPEDDPDEIYRRQLARIDDIVTHFAGRVDCWDVVNEVSHFDREGFLNHVSPRYTRMWQKVGRMELTRACFRHARTANPHATLLINDYKTDADYERVIERLADTKRSVQRERTDGTGAVAPNWLAAQLPYNVIGIQSHMGYFGWSQQRVASVCDRFARFGVPIHFTEASLSSAAYTPKRGQENNNDFTKKANDRLSTAEGEARQAEQIVAFYRAVFAQPAVEALTWWDLCDWSAGGKPTGLLRKDMTPKPAYEALKKLIKQQWWTDVTLKTNQQGHARLRAFYGDHRVTVPVDGNAPIVRNLAVTKGEDNHFTIVVTDSRQESGDVEKE